MTHPQKPLADRIRPRKLEDLAGQDHLIGPGTVLGKALRSGNLFSVIFWGPPGSGKTTLAKLMAQYTQNPFQSFSAVSSGMKELREVVAGAEKVYRLTGKATILFVDEIHRFNKAQQDGFLPHVESGLIVLVGATTENPSFEIIPPLLSRTRVLVLRPLEKEDLRTILNRALSDKESGLGELEIEMKPQAMDHLIDLSSGDARIALNNLEMAVNYVSPNQEGKRILDLAEIEKALSRKALPYDKDGEEHYNIISAFHKSLRGGDAQASLYWLYRMLMAGEDPLFICRRMIRFASEDIGLADARALQVALAAFEAWEKVGPPEAELALAEAAVYLASAPKSNALYLAEKAVKTEIESSGAQPVPLHIRNAPTKLMKELALAEAAVYLASAPKSNALYLAEKAVKTEIESSGAQPVPLHIRNAPTKLMKELGYARGYLYPHNYPGARVKQEYLPEKVRGKIFYRPSNRGFEKEVFRNMEDKKAKEKEEGETPEQ